MTKILMRSVLTLALSITAVTAFAESHNQHANPQANSGIHHGQNNTNHGKDHQSHDDKNSYGKNSSQHANQYAWKAGAVLPRDYRGNRYQFSGYQQAKLVKPAKNQQWLRINRDYVLVNVLNHQIIKVVAVR